VTQPYLLATSKGVYQLPVSPSLLSKNNAMEDMGDIVVTGFRKRIISVQPTKGLDDGIGNGATATTIVPLRLVHEVVVEINGKK
jgi:hypothetical protein